MSTLLTKLQTAFPDLHYRRGGQFSWSPETNEIFYKATAPTSTFDWSLLHETGHAQLEHNTYQADFELLALEVAAWDKARAIAQDFEITIDEDHIQDCLDTYRDWLYRRSICPRCQTKCLQQDDIKHYRCFNCHAIWAVSPSRFCRAYRRSAIVQFS